MVEVVSVNFAGRFIPCYMLVDNNKNYFMLLGRRKQKKMKERRNKHSAKKV